MRINADFSQRALVRLNANNWVASQCAGVRGRMLDQFDPADRTQVQSVSDKAHLSPVATGVDTVSLHADPREQIFMERLTPNTSRSRGASGALEIRDAGAFLDGTNQLAPWDCLRLPVASGFVATARPDGAQVWVKTSHLRDVTGAAA